MKNILLAGLLLVLSGCGISTYLSETKIEKDTTYIPLDIQEQILGYIRGDCAHNSKLQRLFIGAMPLWDGVNKYVYQLQMVLNLDGTYDLQTRTFENDAEIATPTYDNGNFQISNSELQIENIGSARVQLGSSASKIIFELTTPHGVNVMTLMSTWSNLDFSSSPLCP